ncbi:MAG: hypothetical protein KDJ15_07170 [Alphaproteobacteria bacterium]|nr:hypothetical protein [Alphaproteobacteria bacterium]
MEKKSDGVTEIRGGRTQRRDAANVLWTSTFTILNEREVEMVSLADPRDAASDHALTRPDGTPTRQPVAYRATLKYARKDDRIQISGSIAYGDEVIFLTMQKTPDSSCFS